MNLLTRYRMWRCQRDGFDTITPLNCADEWDAASDDTLLFHWILKRPLRRAIAAIRVPTTWIARLDGNAKVLYEIIDDVYFKREKQARRRAFLKPVIEYGLCLCAFDNNYAEVFNATLAGIIRNRDRFAFDLHQCNPDNWYADDRGRIEVTQGPAFKILSVTQTALVTDQRIASKVVTVTATDGAPRYLAIDENAAEPYPGIWVHPILAIGTNPLEVAHEVLA